MPIVIMLIPVFGLALAMPVAIQEQKTEQKVNEICMKKYTKVDEVRVCREILLNREH